jgi:hypothetical protein
MNTRVPFPGVKWLGLESDHYPPSSGKIKKTWIYTSTPPIRLLGVEFSHLSTGTTLHFIKFYDNFWSYKRICTPEIAPVTHTHTRDRSHDAYAHPRLLPWRISTPEIAPVMHKHIRDSSRDAEAHPRSLPWRRSTAEVAPVTHTHTRNCYHDALQSRRRKLTVMTLALPSRAGEAVYTPGPNACPHNEEAVQGGLQSLIQSLDDWSLKDVCYQREPQALTIQQAAQIKLQLVQGPIFLLECINPSNCIRRSFIRSIHLSVPHWKHITSLLWAQPVNVICTFVCTSQGTHYLSTTSQIG